MLNKLKEKSHKKDLIKIKVKKYFKFFIGMLEYDIIAIRAIAMSYLEKNFDKEDRKWLRDLYKNRRKEYKCELEEAIYKSIDLD